jgi:hypothetical protein
VNHRINTKDIEMKTRPNGSVMAMGLLLATGVMAPVGAQLPVADTSGEWAIRPADQANPPTQPTETSSRASVAPPGSESHAGSPQIKTDGGISYASGGVGESERSDLQALSSQFNLHLMFATQGSGEYLSAVQVIILDANKAPVLSAESNGPWFYAQLPPGDYRVEVTPTGLRGEDQTQRKMVHLDGSGQSTLDFYWNK